ncbi:Zinc copper-regulated transcription factor [Apiospora rasikravindrae]|uniref:Zinc copper-regulated transcription factor n=1 Tax=Apiospora rasikravindrae TaxID=990691 RepID=A0ABR1SJX8_9PEZI
MIQVRKPGRPLANCPGHLPGQPCECLRQTVVAAIPRRARCGECRDHTSTTGSTPAPAPQSEHPVNPGAPVASPSKPSFRVSKPVARPSSRRQSHVADNLDRLGRMDPANCNILNGFPNGQMPTEHGPMNFEANRAFQSPMMGSVDPSISPMYPTPLGYPMPMIPPSIHNGNIGIDPAMSLMNGGFAVGNGFGAPEESVGYGSEASGVVFAPASDAGSTSLEAMTPAPPKQLLRTEITEPNDYNQTTGPSVGVQMAQQSPTTAPQNDAIYQTPSHGYSMNYGNSNNPYTWAQWQQQQIQVGGPFAYQPDQDANTQGGLAYTGCTCGSTCECPYCLQHPYNTATRDRILNLWGVVKEENEVPSSVMQESASPNCTTSSTPEALEAGSHVTSSQEGSPTPNEGNYLLIEFPCDGDETNCLCGDSCICDGCATHPPKATQNPPPE